MMTCRIVKYFFRGKRWRYNSYVVQGKIDVFVFYWKPIYLWLLSYCIDHISLHIVVSAVSIMMTGGTPDAGSLAGRRAGGRGVTVASQPTITASMKPTSTCPFLCPC